MYSHLFNSVLVSSTLVAIAIIAKQCFVLWLDKSTKQSLIEDPELQELKEDVKELKRKVNALTIAAGFK